MKKIHWSPILPQKLSATSFWANCHEEQLASNDILAGLVEKFPLKQTKGGLQTYKTLSLKKDIGLRIIDKKCAQNLLILLHSSFKKHSAEQIKQFVLRCDTSILSSDVIEQLLRCLPPVDQINRLCEIRCAGDKLTEGEAFIAILGEIKDVVPRLESINFKLCIEDMVKNVKTNVSSGIAACKEIKSSQKFAKILEMVLLLGNYMNFDSVNGQAYGFKLSVLTRLKDTKDSNNKQTVLHYLAESIEKKFPEVLRFSEDLHHSKTASRIQMADIQETMLMMENSLKNLKSILGKSQESQSPDDIFTDVMMDFSVKTYGEIADLKEMIHEMENCYKAVAEYFSFDAEKYSIEELFTDIETFKASFAQAYKEIQDARKHQGKTDRVAQSYASRRPPSYKTKEVHEQQVTQTVRQESGSADKRFDSSVSPDGKTVLNSVPPLVRKEQVQLRDGTSMKTNQSKLRFDTDNQKRCRGMEIKLTRLTKNGMDILHIITMFLFYI